jgi:hypothetical protein
MRVLESLELDGLRPNGPRATAETTGDRQQSFLKMPQSLARDFYVHYRPFCRCFKPLFGPFAKSQGQAKAFDHPFEAGCAASVSWSLFARKLRMSGIRSGQSPRLEAAVICSPASARASNILLGDRRARQMAQSLGELDHARVNFYPRAGKFYALRSASSPEAISCCPAISASANNGLLAGRPATGRYIFQMMTSACVGFRPT